MKKVIFLGLFLAASILQAQNIGGSATYKTAGSIDFEFGGPNMTPEMKERIKQRMAKEMQKEFTLEFNRNESNYEEVVELEKEGQRGMRFMAMMSGGGMGTIYKNLKEQRFTEESEIFGHEFLIKDELEQLDWKIGKETKSIGNYICQKATALRIREAVTISSKPGQGIKDSIHMDTVNLTAWFTMQIPVSHGPGRYGGLPGLILELNDGDITILCTKVSLNTKEAIEIEEPSGGDVVTEEEYQKISREKMEQMRQNMGNGQGRGGKGRSFEITIGR